MKKKYTKEIIQYSINGEIINSFNNANDAKHILNYDSIISCCKGKYKTAGGFVWRFKGDNFILNIPIKTNGITCKICNSIESTRSMAMHLKWTHSISSENYIKQHGEFRNKKIKQNNIKEKVNIKCELCGEKMMHNRQLMYHLTKHHSDITKHDYIIENILHNEVPLCKCGCGEPVTILKNGKNNDLNKDKYSRDYIKNHWDWEVFSTISKQSKEEIELVNYIKTIYQGEIQTSVRSLISKGEIDIYLPELNIGIEYNGIYWHSEKNGKTKDYHLNKMNKCNKLGVRLIQIFSDEWINKKDIVKSKLNSILNNNKINRIYARKCIVKSINPKDKNEFLNKHHIQGEDRSQIKLGLFYNNILYAVMTFSKPRLSLGGKITNNSIYELSRYASSKYIVGGGLKLISYFQKHYNPIQIYSYSDNRWTDPKNNMYLKMGFNIEKTSKPNYFYTKNYMNRLHRYNFNKFKLKEMGADISKTEFKIMEGLGYTKIWDCGTTKYTLNMV